VKPEARARQKIDQLLAAAGWNVQHFEQLNLSAALGVAVREFPLKSGFADYLLFIDRKAVGVIEAKPEGTTLRGVAEQSEKYLTAYRIPCAVIKNRYPSVTRVRGRKPYSGICATRTIARAECLPFTNQKSSKSG
jgi:predicted type IV restriction endonuclease